MGQGIEKTLACYVDLKPTLEGGKEKEVVGRRVEETYKRLLFQSSKT